MDECSGRVKRFLRPTDLGIAFLKGCQAIEKELVDPETRNRLENDLKAIAEGSVDHQMVHFFASFSFLTYFSSKLLALIITSSEFVQFVSIYSG